MQSNMPNTELETSKRDHHNSQSLSLSIQETIAATVEPNDLAYQQNMLNAECESEGHREGQRYAYQTSMLVSASNERSEPYQKGQSSVR
jgi:hypothetical protein